MSDFKYTAEINALYNIGQFLGRCNFYIFLKIKNKIVFFPCHNHLRGPVLKTFNGGLEVTLFVQLLTLCQVLGVTLSLKDFVPVLATPKY